MDNKTGMIHVAAGGEDVEGEQWGAVSGVGAVGLGHGAERGLRVRAATEETQRRVEDAAGGTGCADVDSGQPRHSQHTRCTSYTDTTDTPNTPCAPSAAKHPSSRTLDFVRATFRAIRRSLHPVSVPHVRKRSSSLVLGNEQTPSYGPELVLDDRNRGLDDAMHQSPGHGGAASGTQAGSGKTGGVSESRRRTSQVVTVAGTGVAGGLAVVTSSFSWRDFDTPGPTMNPRAHQSPCPSANASGASLAVADGECLLGWDDERKRLGGEKLLGGRRKMVSSISVQLGFKRRKRTRMGGARAKQQLYVLSRQDGEMHGGGDGKVKLGTESYSIPTYGRPGINRERGSSFC
ncbi:hypothetical protein HDU93_000985 [Gonapodya sp. JEL0774]|nr:hypothetical protein HDU93_000985 [Gonapodya sp. JEL0774]